MPEFPEVFVYEGRLDKLRSYALFEAVSQICGLDQPDSLQLEGAEDTFSMRLQPSSFFALSSETIN